MSVTVFLSNTNIQIVVGSGTKGGAKVKRLVSVSVPNGAVLNGVVMDETALVLAIKECWKLNKLPKGDVTLILNSPQLRANIIDMPLLPDKKTNDFVQRESKDSRFERSVSAWYLVEKNPKAKKQKVISETADAKFINTYVDIFNRAGVRLLDIHDGVTLAIGLLKGATRNKTVVYMILDGTSLVTIFFSKGQYFYHSTKRVFNQPGSTEFAKEIFGAISEIRQFASVQKLDDSIEEIQFAGLGDQQVVRLSEDISDFDSNINLSSVTCPSYVKSKESLKQFPYFVYPIAGLSKLNPTRVDIMTANRKSEDKFVQRRRALKWILPAGGFLLLLVMTYAALFTINFLKQRELKELNRINSEPATVANVKRYEQITDVIKAVGSRQGGLNLLHQYLDSYPIPDYEVNKLISNSAEKYGVTVIFNSYNATSGVFSITAQSEEVEKINQFIADLMKMDTFEKIDYTGYTAIKNKRGESGWQINVVCSLSARKTESEKADKEA